MSSESVQRRLKEAGFTAWRLIIFAAAIALILTLYVGMAVLVYRGRMSAGPMILFTGVILGYLLRAVPGWM